VGAFDAFVDGFGQAEIVGGERDCFHAVVPKAQSSVSRFRVSYHSAFTLTGMRVGLAWRLRAKSMRYQRAGRRLKS
ncbi:MAG: hypothetical protein ABSC06_12000, partial [Rhodopila sp.]